MALTLRFRYVQVARLGIAFFLFFLALIAVLAGISLLAGENEDLTNRGELVVGVLWLASAAVYALAGALLLRRALDGRALAVLAAALVAGGVLLTVNPYVGAPITAVALLAAVLGFAR